MSGRPDAADPRALAPVPDPNDGLEALLARPLADEDLDRATAALAAPIERRSAERTSLLVVRAGGELLAVRSVDTALVAPPGPVHRVPHRRGPVVRGSANLDGEILLGMALEAALGLPAPAGARPRASLVVVGGTRDRWAFEVDEVVGVVDVPASAMRAPPVTVAVARNGCIATLARLEHGEASVLDAGALAAIFRGAVG
ncbi:MAG: chemotaxis protein CheW [Phycisphaerales bacterium]